MAKITTHETDALNRLIEQYKELPRIEAVIKATTDQDQEIENQIESIRLARQIETAVGDQLDRIGKLVGQPRQGFDDDFYRILLYVKIGQNVSNGEPERIISVMSLLAQTEDVHLLNLGSAEVDIGIGITPDPSLVDFVYQNIERVVMAGVRLGKIISYDATEPFAFDGPGESTPGFGSTTNPALGGKFATLLFRTTPFSFSGSDETSAGFGSVLDPIVGGRFVGV